MYMCMCINKYKIRIIMNIPVLPKPPSGLFNFTSHIQAMATSIVTKSSKRLFLKKTFKLVTFPRFLRLSPKSSKAIPNETTRAPYITTTKMEDNNIILKEKNMKEETTMRYVFNHFDFNKDGKISCEELMQYLESAGESVSVNGAKRVIRDFDSDGDDLLEYGDFLRLLEGKEKDETEEDVMRSAFEKFEVKKGCGYITPKSLQEMLRQLGDMISHEECAEIIRVFDLDGNGSLDFHEFQQMMMTSSPS